MKTIFQFIKKDAIYVFLETMQQGDKNMISGASQKPLTFYEN